MKHMHHLCPSALLLALFIISGSAQALSPRTTGIYSDMSYNTAGGDVIGTEIFVVDTDRGYYVVFQSGEGEPSVPVVVPAMVSGPTIRFTLPPGTAGGTFTGTVSTNELVGSFSSNHQTIHLKRKASYWQ